MENLILKNENIVNFDPNQISNLTFDGKKDAIRVSVVDGIKLNVDQLNIPEGVFNKESSIITKIERIEVPVIVKEIQFERIEVPIYQKEVISIDKPVLIPEIKIIEIEKPVIVKETVVKVIEIEKLRMSNFEKICMVLQIIALFGILLINKL